MSNKGVESKENACNRFAGVLLHPTSFPSKYGIGELGESAFEFIDFLKAAGQKLWQVLPLGPTGYGDSPYQSFSAFAGQPLIISIDRLIEMGLLNEKDLKDYPVFDDDKIDFGPVIESKTKVLRRAYENFKTLNDKKIKKEFDTFYKKNEDWLFDYSLFMAGKDYHDGDSWLLWNDELSSPDEQQKKEWAVKLSDSVGYYRFIQYIFFKQWNAVKKYANKKGIKIIGDIPIFVSIDSADVWANKKLFKLDSKGFPISVAGVPPDYFSETGQLWGNPLYDFAEHKKDGYSWWIKRIKAQLTQVDYLRIDHFRGFEAYWSIPYGDETAINGEWVKGPCKDLFRAIEKELGKLPILAEDLGVITEEVEDLRDTFQFPGMKVLQFGFDNVEENDFIPHNFTTNNCICYTGTHDNDTTLGWYSQASDEAKEKVNLYVNSDGSDISWDFIRMALSSISKYAIYPVQDILSLGSEARMNIPGTQSGNWSYRYKAGELDSAIAKRLKQLTKLYGR